MATLIVLMGASGAGTSELATALGAERFARVVPPLDDLVVELHGRGTGLAEPEIHRACRELGARSPRR